MDVTLEQHHEAVMDKLHDIDEDTDCILRELGGKDMTDGFDSGMLAGLLSKQGVDPALVAMLNNCKRVSHTTRPENVPNTINLIF